MKKQARVTPINRLRERVLRWTNDSEHGQRFARWTGKTAAGLQLRLTIKSVQKIPWTPLKRPLAEATVALVATGGIHLCSDQPFDLGSDASFRVIPRTALNEDLCISHRRYDRRDAASDPNLIFPLERLLELEREGVIGRVADVHYGFGFIKDPQKVIVQGRKVASLLAQAGVDLVVLVPAWPACTRSVGLLAREIEAHGVTTVALALVRELATEVKAPRMLYLHWPFGHALGEPGNRDQQYTILHDLFSMARLAPRPGLIVDLPYQWKRHAYNPILDWTTESEDFRQALDRALESA